jgi:site-specific recombinase XerD
MKECRVCHGKMSLIVSYHPSLQSVYQLVTHSNDTFISVHVIPIVMSDLKSVLMKKKEGCYERYGWTDEQRTRFEDFIRERYSNFRKPEPTISTYMDALNNVVVEIKKPFSEMTYEDLQPILQKWHGFSSATNYVYRSRLKAFLRWESEDKHDPRAEKIRAGSYFSPITLDDLLTEDEIEKLREEAKDNPRNLAMLDFHLLWGPRPSESIKLRIADVKVHDSYITINISQTKTISRPVPIPLTKVSLIKDPIFLDSALNAYTSLMRYLNVHPGYPDVPASPLWYGKTNFQKPLKREGMTAIFRRLGKAAGLKKTVSTYVLRRTAFNRFKGIDRDRLCAGFGWRPGSRMPTTIYNKLRPQDYLETLVKTDEVEHRNVHICPNCNRENPNDFVFCAWCSTPLVELPMSATLDRFHADKESQKELEELRKKMTEMEKMMKAMVNLPGFDKLIEEAAEKSS